MEFDVGDYWFEIRKYEGDHPELCECRVKAFLLLEMVAVSQEVFPRDMSSPDRRRAIMHRLAEVSMESPWTRFPGPDGLEQFRRWAEFDWDIWTVQWRWKKLIPPEIRRYLLSNKLGEDYRVWFKAQSYEFQEKQNAAITAAQEQYKLVYGPKPAKPTKKKPKKRTR